MNTSFALELQNVTKMYGNDVGVKNISLNVEQGAIFGFLGPNGAGKTTTISMIVNLLNPTSGTIRLFGNTVTRNNVALRNHVGYLSSDMALEESLTGQQQLAYFGMLRGGDYTKTAHQLAARLDADLTRRIKHLSRGNRQKIGLISALMHNPKLLILDEPTSGLDPLVQEQFNEIVTAHKNKGGTTFISSHILSEVQALCDHVAFIKSGEIIANDTVESLLSAAPYQVSITAKNSSDTTKILSLKGIGPHVIKHNTATFTYSGNVNDLLKQIAKFNIAELHIGRSDLDAIFMHHYTKEG